MNDKNELIRILGLEKGKKKPLALSWLAHRYLSTEHRFISPGQASSLLSFLADNL